MRAKTETYLSIDRDDHLRIASKNFLFSFTSCGILQSRNLITRLKDIKEKERTVMMELIGWTLGLRRKNLNACRSSKHTQPKWCFEKMAAAAAAAAGEMFAFFFFFFRAFLIVILFEF